jgi:predicted dehydrogenase
VQVSFPAVRVAVIGCGRWGPNHIRNFHTLPGSQVAACVDPDQSRLERVKELFPGVQTSRYLGAVLADRTIDAVVVATPTGTHHAIVRRALLAGKHVLCEKPLCVRGRQAEELARLARRARRILMVGHVFLFNAGVAKLKELVVSKRLGKLHYLSAIRTNFGPIRGDVNALYDLASHDIAIFNWLLGDIVPQWVSATGAAFLQRGIEDVVFLSLKYPGGVHAGIHASWLNPSKTRQIIVVGSKKMVSWDDQELSTPIAIYDKGANVDQTAADYGEFLRLSMWDGDVRLPKIRLEEPLKVQDRCFIQAIQSGSLKKSGGDFAAGVVRVLEAAARSIRSKGHPVPL